MNLNRLRARARSHSSLNLRTVSLDGSIILKSTENFDLLDTTDGLKIRDKRPGKPKKGVLPEPKIHDAVRTGGKHDGELKIVNVMPLSGNGKIGDSAATYGPFRSCPKECCFHPDGPKMSAALSESALASKARFGGCYADGGNIAYWGVGAYLDAQAELMAATKVQMAQAEADGIREIARKLAGTGRNIRVHIKGDCDSPEAAKIVSSAVEDYMNTVRRPDGSGGLSWSYTHSWKKVPRSAWGKVSILASIEDPRMGPRALTEGYMPCLVLPAEVVQRFVDRQRRAAKPGETPDYGFVLEGVKYVLCPAQINSNRYTCSGSKEGLAWQDVSKGKLKTYGYQNRAVSFDEKKHKLPLLERQFEGPLPWAQAEESGKWREQVWHPKTDACEFCMRDSYFKGRKMGLILVTHGSKHSAADTSLASCRGGWLGDGWDFTRADKQRGKKAKKNAVRTRSTRSARSTKWHIRARVRANNRSYHVAGTWDPSKVMGIDFGALMNEPGRFSNLEEGEKPTLNEARARRRRGR